MEGFLEVWHGFFSRWVKYYFRIHQDTLIFGPKRQVIQSKIHLKVAQIISIVDDPISFIIHTGTDTLRIRANSIDERVRWFKKLKKIQKNIQEQNYTKQMSSINNEKSKSNKIKMLQSIALDLWQYHAQLQSQVNDISDRCKTIPGVKTLTEKLRMNVQSIKLKTSEALKIIQQYTRTQRQKRGTATPKGAFRLHTPEPYQMNQNSNYLEPDGTMFLSFQDNKNGNLLKKFKKQSQIEEFKKLQESLKSVPHKPAIRINQIQNSTVTPFKLQSSMKKSSAVVQRNFNIQNQIKQRLLQKNPVYIEVKKTLGTNKTRTHLPQKFTPQQKFPLGSIVKGAIGADLTKFALPVALNEPISLLQKGCQQMYYTKLLEEANQQKLPQNRMLYIVAFLISAYSLSDLRLKKPFNPLLGQTFQFYDTQRQFIFTSQQVSHHPPISAIYCRSDSFQIFDKSQGKTTFTGTAIKIAFEGKSKIKLQKHENQQYIYDKCPIFMNNLLIGKTQLQAIGQMTVQCKSTRNIAKIGFKQQSFFNKSSIHEIQGEIKSNNQKIYTINGKWNQYIKAIDLRNKSTQTIWNKTHICNKDYYYFNDYTMLLNYLHKQNLAQMAPTDSRLRPDQRSLQYRNMDLAESQKLRLEQKQRAKRKQNQEKKIVHKMKWFQIQTDEDGNQFYVLNNRNKMDSQNGQWPNYPDIF